MMAGSIFMSGKTPAEAFRVQARPLGSTRVPRVGFGVAPKRTLAVHDFFTRPERHEKVRDREDALANTRDACAPQKSACCVFVFLSNLGFVIWCFSISAMAQVTIEPIKNGPYIVTGEVQLIDADGNKYPAEKRMALCRCGASTEKPFCDGTHSKIGFKAAEKAVPESKE
jgi:3-phenylpropionate/trans-cinnamate dioxygenase ferredoxin subunit